MAGTIPPSRPTACALIRTCTTAGAVWKPKGLTLHTELRFREVHMGVWEDAPFGQVMREQPEVYRKFAKAPQEWAVEGSERYEEFTGRFLQALDEIARQYDGQSVAIFSHGMVLQNALGRLFFGGDTNKLPFLPCIMKTALTGWNRSLMRPICPRRSRPSAARAGGGGRITAI